MNTEESQTAEATGMIHPFINLHQIPITHWNAQGEMYPLHPMQNPSGNSSEEASDSSSDAEGSDSSSSSSDSSQSQDQYSGSFGHQDSHNAAVVLSEGISPKTPAALDTVTVPLLDVKTPPGNGQKQNGPAGWNPQTNLSTPNFHESSLKFPPISMSNMHAAQLELALGA